MERQEIIKLFLNKGYQVDSSTLDFFSQNPNKINIFLEEINKTTERPSTITSNFVKLVLKEKSQIQILRNFLPEQKIITTEKTIQFFIDRYEKIKKILNGRLDLVNLISINKITPRTKKFSIIVMIKEKIADSNSIVVEDLTGELIVHLSEKMSNFFEQIVLDEVVGLVCEAVNDRIVVNNIVWPDIPLRREVNKTNENIFCLFISDLHLDSKQFNHASYEKFLNWLNQVKYDNFYIFVLGDVSSRKEDIEFFFTKLPEKFEKIFLSGDTDSDFSDALKINNPSLISIENSVLLLCHGDHLEKYSNMWQNLSIENIMLNLLRKRHINPTFDSKIKVSNQDYFVLDVIPDIFVSGHFHKPGILNYKGTTIISNGSFVTQPIFWIINLRTRESFKLDFT